jgi:hypothetical protein
VKVMDRPAWGLVASWLLLSALGACGSSAGSGQPSSKADAGDGAAGNGDGGPALDASDAVAPDTGQDALPDSAGDAPAEGGSGIIDVSGTWDAVDVAGSLAGSGVTCAKTSFVMTETATQLEVAERAFSCTYTSNSLPAAVTFPDVTFTISGNQLLANGQPAGTIDASSVHVNDCLGGACTVITLTQTQPNRLDYSESASVSGNTQSQLAGKLFKEGTYTPGQLSVQPSPVDFGTLAPGSTPTQTLTLTNNGGELAEDIAASGLSAQVSFAGGTYPGTAGTCGTSLGSGKSCSVVVQAVSQPTFTAGTSFSTMLQLDYSSVGTAYTTSVAIKGTDPVIEVAKVFSGPTFGMAIAADGTLALAGAPECGNVAPTNGCVEAFVEQNGTWKSGQRLIGGSQYFGVGVAVSGTQALIETNSTIVPYTWDGTQWSVASQGAFSVSLGSNSDTTKSLSIGMSGNAAVVSSGANSALAILAFDGTNWSIVSTPSGTWGAAAVSGSWIAAGDSAGVHMFHLSGGTWSDVQTLSSTGTSLALDGTTLAVGMPSVVALYTYDGTNWTSAQTLADPSSQSGSDHFAALNTVALRGGHLFVGASGYSIYVQGFIMQGEVFASALSGTTWSAWTTFTENTLSNLELGGAVALSGSFALATDPLTGQVAFIPY